MGKRTRTISEDTDESNEIPSGGPPESPHPRPATVTEEAEIPTAPPQNTPTNRPWPGTIHSGSPVITVQLGSRPPGVPSGGTEPVGRFHMDPEVLEKLDFPRRLAVLGGPNLFGKNRFYDIELATLQRMAIHDLQHRLVRLVAHIHNNQYADEGAMDMARRLLDEYSSAIRNYDLMSEKKERSRAVGHADPFLITTEDRLSFILMEREGLFKHPTHTPENIEILTNELKGRSKAWDPERNMLPGESRTAMGRQNQVRLFFERLTLGVFGGLAIIAPMLIMALVNSLLVSLIVTSVATMVFAMLLALPRLGGGMNGQTVLASVAAYAAILVVFIGTSLSI